jgi:hypothetical protein
MGRKALVVFFLSLLIFSFVGVSFVSGGVKVDILIGEDGKPVLENNVQCGGNKCRAACEKFMSEEVKAIVESNEGDNAAIGKDKIFSYCTGSTSLEPDMKLNFDDNSGHRKKFIERAKDHPYNLIEKGVPDEYVWSPKKDSKVSGHGDDEENGEDFCDEEYEIGWDWGTHTDCVCWLNVEINENCEKLDEDPCASGEFPEDLGVVIYGDFVDKEVSAPVLIKRNAQDAGRVRYIGSTGGLGKSEWEKVDLEYSFDDEGKVEETTLKVKMRRGGSEKYFKKVCDNGMMKNKVAYLLKETGSDYGNYVDDGEELNFYIPRDACSKEGYVHVNWNPGMLIADRGVSAATLNFMKKYIKIFYGGDGYDRPRDSATGTRTPITKDIQDKGTELTFGWSDGGAAAWTQTQKITASPERAGKNVEVGMFRFDPTGSGSTEASKRGPVSSDVDYYVTMLSKARASKGLWEPTGEVQREILVNMGGWKEFQHIPVASLFTNTGHWASDHELTKALFQIYTSCLVNRKDKSYCSSKILGYVQGYKQMRQNRGKIGGDNEKLIAQIEEEVSDAIDTWIAERDTSTSQSVPGDSAPVDLIRDCEEALGVMNNPGEDMTPEQEEALPEVAEAEEAEEVIETAEAVVSDEGDVVLTVEDSDSGEQEQIVVQEFVDALKDLAERGEIVRSDPMYGDDVLLVDAIELGSEELEVEGDGAELPVDDGDLVPEPSGREPEDITKRVCVKPEIMGETIDEIVESANEGDVEGLNSILDEFRENDLWLFLGDVDDILDEEDQIIEEEVGLTIVDMGQECPTPITGEIGDCSEETSCVEKNFNPLSISMTMPHDPDLSGGAVTWNTYSPVVLNPSTPYATDGTASYHLSVSDVYSYNVVDNTPNWHRYTITLNFVNPEEGQEGVNVRVWSETTFQGQVQEKVWERHVNCQSLPGELVIGEGNNRLRLGTTGEAC